MNPYVSMCLELIKLSQGSEVSEREALEAAKRLRKLDADRPTPATLARGALAGGVVGTASGLTTKAVGGSLGALGEGFRGTFSKGVKGVPAGIARGLLHAGRQVAAPAAGSAVFGFSLPLVSQHLQREAEMEKIRSHLGMSELKPGRSRVRQVLGVG